MTNPAGVDDDFAAMTSPATGMMLSEEAITYTMDDPAHNIAIGCRYGIRILTPD